MMAGGRVRVHISRSPSYRITQSDSDNQCMIPYIMRGQLLEKVATYAAILLLMWLTLLVLLQKGGQQEQGVAVPPPATATLNSSSFAPIGVIPSRASAVEHNLRSNAVANISAFEEAVDDCLSRAKNGYTDLEIVDMLEHFFWGATDGVAVELGAKNGAYSMIQPLTALGWRRVLMEGNPKHWTQLIQHAVDTDIVTSPICRKEQLLHYANRSDHTAGIVEFMSKDFLRCFYYDLYEAAKPPGNVSSISNWSRFPYVQQMLCVPMSTILRSLRIRHVHFFLLDVAVSYLR